MVNEFTAINLKSKDFRNKNLEEEDFSYKDIRGADFSYANLKNANFTQVTAGLPQSWKVGLTTFCLFLILLAGIISAYGGAVIGYLVIDDAEQLSFFGFLASIVLTIFLFIIISRGLGTMRSLAEIIATGLIATTILVTVIAFAPEQENNLNIALGAEFTILGLAGVATGILDMALAVAIAKEIFLPRPKVLTGAFAFLGAVLGAQLGVRSGIAGYFISGIVAIITIILGIHIGLQAISNNQKYWLIRWLVINIVAIGSTKFIGANLTDADFTKANLTHTDFSNAILTRTCWSQAKGLDFARREVSSSYEIVELSVGDSINPQAAALALQQLRQKYADKFELLAIEGTEKNNLKLHTKITESNSPLQLSDEFTQMYREIQLLPDSTREKILLEGKVQILEKLFTKAIEKPTYSYYRNIEIGKGNYSESIEGDYIDRSRKVNISGNAQVTASGANSLSLGDDYGTVANTISQLPSFDAEPDKQKLKELLSQLQTAVLVAELDGEDKEDTLEQIKAIAEALPNSQDDAVKKTAKQAVKILRGTAAALSPSAAMVTICNQLPDLISKIF